MQIFIPKIVNYSVHPMETYYVYNTKELFFHSNEVLYKDSNISQYIVYSFLSYS